jgi:hypothetical protein
MLLAVREAQRFAAVSCRFCRSPPTEREPRVARAQQVHEARRVGRVVLAVAVQGDDVLAPRRHHAGADERLWPEFLR